MADEEFREPRLAAVYDLLDADRRDLDPYIALAERLGARRVLDAACGTGVLALRLADRGMDVTGVDLAGASLDVARVKPGADRVTWLHGDAAALPTIGCDLVVMTGNAAQALVDDAQWSGFLSSAHAALRPGGTLALETRVPKARAWEGWTRAATLRTTDLPGAGPVTTWTDTIDVRPPLVTFRAIWRSAADGAELTSESTLRFRPEEEVRADLAAHGFVGVDVQDAPDRPGLELVFVANRG